MTFALYLLALVLVLVKPVEAFAPGLAEYRLPMLVLLVAFGAAFGSALRTGAMAVHGRHLLLLAGLAGSVAMSQVAQGWLGGAGEALTDFMPSILLFLSTVMVVTTTARLQATCRFIALGMVLLAAAGIAAYHYGFMVEDLVISDGGANGPVDYLGAPAGGAFAPADDASGLVIWRVRSWGFLNDPNDFAQALVMALPMLFGAGFEGHALRKLFRVWLPAAILVYALWLTRSRGGLLGLGIILAYGMLQRTGPMRAGVAVTLLAVAAMATGATGGRGYSSDEASAGGRIDAWSEGLAMLSHHPVFGVGYGNFIEHHDYTAHNSFVFAFAEIGLVGYAFWVALLVLAFRELFAARAATPPGSDEARWALLLQLSLAGFLTCAMFLSRTFVPTLYVLLGLCYACWHCARQASAAELPPVDVQGAAAEPVATGGWIDVPVRWVLATMVAVPTTIMLIYVVVRLRNLGGG